jgi:hypothetical protein
MTDIFRSNVDI